jgi:hypothetical protein
MRLRALNVAAGIWFCPAIIAAQTGTLVGIVVRDSLGHEVAGAQAMLPDFALTATANYMGEFRFTKVPAGRVAIVIRHVGFRALYDTVVVKPGVTLEREFMLTESPVVQLDTVTVKAAEKKRISPGLQEFEERRKMGFGHFITEDVIRKNESSTLVNIIIGHMPGLKAMPGGRYVASTRKCGNGPAIIGCGRVTSLCPATLYVDGVLVYDTSVDPNMKTVPDMVQMPVTDYAAIEFYSGPATTPAKYNKTGADCGTILLWSRER